MSIDRCPICGEGNLTDCTRDERFEYKKEIGTVLVKFTECDFCGEQATIDQIRDNKRAIIAFKKQVDNLLSGKEIEQFRAKYKLTQAQASKLFGGGPVAFSKYENDDVIQSEAMDRLIRVASALPTALAFLAKLNGESDVALRVMQNELKEIEQRLFDHKFKAKEERPVWSSIQPFKASSWGTTTTFHDCANHECYEQNALVG